MPRGMAGDDRHGSKPRLDAVSDRPTVGTCGPQLAPRQRGCTCTRRGHAPAGIGGGDYYRGHSQGDGASLLVVLPIIVNRPVATGVVSINVNRVNR